MADKIWDDGREDQSAEEVLHAAYVMWRQAEEVRDDVTFGHFAMRLLTEAGYRVEPAN